MKNEWVIQIRSANRWLYYVPATMRAKLLTLEEAILYVRYLPDGVCKMRLYNPGTREVIPRELFV